MKKTTSIIAYTLTCVCCCVFASVITTNLVNRKNSNTVYVTQQDAPY